MIERSRDFGVMVLTPPGIPEPDVAVAASRAGAVGLLDLEYVADPDAALAAVERLVRLGRTGRTGGAIGLKLDGSDDALATGIAEALPAGAATVLLTPAEPGRLAGQIRRLQDRGMTVLLEATDLEEARLGQALGVAGLVAKGNEAGGRVGEESTFVLLQRLRASVALPIWAQGGIGFHTAAAALVAGAVGVVLDAQLALARESRLPDEIQAWIARMDGSETAMMEASERYRVLRPPGVPDPRVLLGDGVVAPRERLRREVREGRLWLLGQDAAFAATFAGHRRGVGEIVRDLRDAVGRHVTAAARLAPLGEGAALARSHGTRYPIVQGPMTRVSDGAPFAAAVAAEGALPFLALALMRAAEVDELLTRTHHQLGDRPWGVGVLGFVEAELRREQLAAIRAHRPPFALIAGGRPEQARELEEAGIATYLHVPSPGLLRLFAEQGARRFVFEGRECGGHVGPRSSFVLWETMVDTLSDALPNDLEACHVLFAGGVHDAVSAAMVAAVSAPLAERGARVGVLLGTAYLFTEEAVATGAIVPAFQQEALRCSQTVLLESGPGHVTRCADTPYVETFAQERQRLLAVGESPDALRSALEDLNLGRLRLASKGLLRHAEYGREPTAPKLVAVDDASQRRDGMYMIGQVAALRDQPVAMADLHREVASGAHVLEQARAALPTIPDRPTEPPSEVAIVGIACLLPGAPDAASYWENILAKVDAVTEIPAERWDWRRYYDSDPKARDRIYARWGGFLEEVPFDPVRYGMPPSALPSIEPLQLLTLEVARAALEDAGYSDRPFPRQRTSVILGAGGGVAELGNRYAVRAALPGLLDNVPEGVLDGLPEWTEDSFPGLLLNVAAGRVANRFDLGGVNYVVDAACASSLAAVQLGVRELEAHTSEMVLVGGVEAVQSPFGYLCFSKTQALSATGRCRPFDDAADGIAISEGLVMLVLKRLADAERDGDRIYAVIRGVAGSSDGRAKGLTAPRPEGQALALERAYAKAGFTPASVGLIEAHGTGTVVGDQAEIATLKRVFDDAGAARRSCAVGSVKSMIGHTKCAAGVAGLAKAALALHHRVLPPTLHVAAPNRAARFDESPFYVNTETRPWIHAAPHPRRAGVSAFGFGGTNFHAVLEAYDGDLGPGHATARSWPAELLLIRAGTHAELTASAAALAAALNDGAEPALRDLGYALWQRARREHGLTLALVATSLDDVRAKLARALSALHSGDTAIRDPAGIYLSDAAAVGAVAFLFPGQGSQAPGMLGELAVHFDEVREAFERGDRELSARLPERLSSYVFPPPPFGADEARAQQRELTRTEVAQPALGAAGMGALALLRALGVRPDMVAGHSYGEYPALCAAGVFDEAALARLSEARGRFIAEAADGGGVMAAASAGRDAVASALAGLEGVWVANVNGPSQTVISGRSADVDRAVEALKAGGISARPLPVACAFHSPLVAAARDRLAELVDGTELGAPRLPVFANATAAPYPDDPPAIAGILADHLTSPVLFADQIEAMYAAGARVFVEAGPRAVLTGLVGGILDGRPHVAVALDPSGRPGLLGLLHALGQLACAGVPVDLERLYRGRGVRRIDLDALAATTRPAALPATTWLVHGGGTRPLREAVPAAERDAATPTGAARAAEPPAPPPSAPPPPGVPEPHVPEPPVPEPHVPEPPVPEPLVSEQLVPPPRVPEPSGAVPTRPSGDGGASGHDAIVLGFQDLMLRFLDTQRAVMQAYLAGAPDGAGQALDAIATSAEPAPPEATHALLEARPAALVTAALPPAGSVATATEPTGAVPSSAVPTGTVAPPPDPKAPHDVEGLLRALQAVVSERTGYPADMLDADLDVEADLGIDSIKRVEILGTFARTVLPDGGTGALEALTGLRTLRALAEAAAAQLAPAAPTAPEAERPTPLPSPVPSPTSNAEGARGTLVLDRLRRIVGERTGYPLEMLDADLDLEADLGIDSIKRVEILGSFQQAEGADGTLAGVTEQLVGCKSLRAIADAIDRFLDAAPAAGSAEAPAAAPVPATFPAPVDAPVPSTSSPARLVLSATEVPPPPAGAPPAGVVVVTDDGRGIAAFLAQTLRTRGVRVVLARHLGEPDGADFASPASVADLVARIRRRDGDVAAVVHLLPLAAVEPFDALDRKDWNAHLELATLGLFHLLQATAPDLRRTPGSRVIAATSLGGAFAGLRSAPPLAPSHGGVAGLVKTVALEWPEVQARVVDVDPSAEARVAAESLLVELLGEQDVVEVGYRGGSRLATRWIVAPLAAGEASTPEPVVGPGQVLLVTGGARGITAEVTLELAARYRPTLVLVGRSPLPPPRESADTAGHDTARDLKAALIERLRRAGEEVAPAKVEAAYQALLREREVRRNLEALRAAGAVVDYRRVDVRDVSALGETVADVYRTYGRIDGAIHGAGIIEDKLLEDKSPDSFSRVLATKTNGAFALARALQPESLRFLAFFGSVAGCFGNRGQADYAAANEVLNKLAVALDSRWPGRVVTVNWGPWAHAGMVAEEVQREFVKRGVPLIDPRWGRKAFELELRAGRKGDVEIVLGPGPWHAPEANGSAVDSQVATAAFGDAP